MGHRRKGRELALQGLYMHETVRAPYEQLIDFSWSEEEIPADIADYARKLITGVLDKQDDIDKLIVEYSRNWSLERIGAVDKAILRLSIYSLIFDQDIPAAVTINEAIELGNDTEYGLVSYVFSTNEKSIRQLSEELEFGEVQVNGVKYAIYLPHGGVKESGIGHDCSYLALHDYLVKKRITTAL